MPAKFEPPYYPIIYVRGYAGSQDAVEETVATPYMGFNAGATKVRQRWNGEIARHVFESPLVRLMKDFGYKDVYSEGSEMLDGEKNERPVVIYRYYEQVSDDLGSGRRPEIEEYARGLDRLIDRLREAWCGHTGESPDAFKVYLVAHSMGGLICRCFLQNRAMRRPQTDRLPDNLDVVDKVFTYATPHGGIDVRLLGNIPSFMQRNNMDNFNRDRMRGFLALPHRRADVQSLDGKFPEERFFCLVGTNAADYDVASGWSSRAVGPLSDGLVRIDNAYVRGAPRAYVHRAHSGHYGIVNSEEGYQNLTRFFFGNVRVDGVLEVDELDLPTKVRRALDDDKEVRASYHFEVVVRTRRSLAVLHSRTAQESSAIFRTFDEMLRVDDEKKRHPHLFSTYLSTHGRKGGRPGALVFAVDLRVRVPDYEIDGFAFFDQHIEGSYLYNETILIAALPPKAAGEPWRLRYGTNPLALDPASRDVAGEDLIDETTGEATADGGQVFRVPVKSRPGMTGTLKLIARPWS